MRGRKLREERKLFHAYLRQRGLKRTYQKDLILATFLGAEGHMSIEDIHSLVRRKDRKIGIVTVFRTMKSLGAGGIAREISLGDGRARYEHSYHHPHHHHVICDECHKVIEFVSPRLERLQDEIAGKYSFQSDRHHFQIYGVCEDCRLERPDRDASEHDTEKIFARDALQAAIVMEKRGLEFYREAAGRNQDPSGQEVLARIIEEQLRHLAVLESELTELQHREKGVDRVPVFLHFDPGELEKLIPDLRLYQQGGHLRLDARRCMEVALQFEQRASDFFRDYAGKFVETQGKRIFLQFAQEEIEHTEEIHRRMNTLAPGENPPS